MIFSEFQIDFEGRRLASDWCGVPTSHPLVILHGAGNGTRDRFSPLRKELADNGESSLSLDFLGHGKTGGELSWSSLASRTEQAKALIQAAKVQAPLRLLGSSMGAYNAIKLAETHDVSALVLFVPGVYTPNCYDVPFGPEFSEMIRKDRSWDSTDAWQILSGFEGRLLVVAAEQDKIIPPEIPQRLLDAAVSALSRELYWVKESPHLLVHFLNENPEERAVVQRKIEVLLHEGV